MEQKGLLRRTGEFLFGRRNEYTSFQPAASCAAPAPAAVHLQPKPVAAAPAAPARTTVTAPTIVQTSAQVPAAHAAESPVTTASMKTDFPLKKSFIDRVGFESDYSWVTGQLFYVCADGGIWIVRYAPQEVSERYGGKLVMSSNVNMKNFREGDLVSVHGKVLTDSHGSKLFSGPMYQVERIDMIERGEQ
jgi:hypothetical protein